MSPFPAQLAEQAKSPPQAQKALFSSGLRRSLQMTNLNQIGNLGPKTRTARGERVRVHDGSWLGFPAPPEKSERLRCLNPQPEPLI